MESKFSLIVANFRSERLADVERVLEQLGVERINVAKVKGFGEYHNYFARSWLDSEVRVEVFTKAHRVEKVVAAIIEAARTGSAGYPGDGVVAVLPIEKLYLIRTACEATADNFWPNNEARPVAS